MIETGAADFPAIETAGLTKFYGPRCVVNNLRLTVPAGTVFGFLGRNGAGKSTTIRMLLGIVQPTWGEIRLLGQPRESLGPETRSRVGYLAEGHPLYGWMGVAEAVKFRRTFYPERWNQTLADRILEHFKLPSRAKIGRLSQGQRGQVALALAVAPDPDLLILDDPSLGLDTVARREFLVSLIQLIQREGRTILYSSHMLADVERVADRIGILVDGVLRVDCPTGYFKRAVQKVVLEFPSTPPRFPECDGVVNVWTFERRLELAVVNFGDNHRAAIELLAPLSCDVIEMNFEDAFVEYTRGELLDLLGPPGDQRAAGAAGQGGA